MRRVAVGLASLIAVSFTGPASSESEFDAIQNAEQPGSQINFTLGGGRGFRPGAPMVVRYLGALPGPCSAQAAERPTAAELPPDPDFPQEGDAVDNALPGEGPERPLGSRRRRSSA